MTGWLWLVKRRVVSRPPSRLLVGQLVGGGDIYCD